jgi:hypothetical protein
VDLLTARALGPKPMGKSGGGSVLNSKLMWWRVPSGAKESQGSDARSNDPPEQSVSPGTTTICQVVPPSKLTPRHVAPGPPVGPAVLLPERRDVVGIGGVHIHPRFDFAMEEVDPSARHHAREVATLLQRAKRAGVRDLDERLDGLSPSRSAAHERGHAEADHQPSDPPPCHG